MKLTSLKELSPKLRLLLMAFCGLATLLSTGYALMRPRLPRATNVVAAVETGGYDASRDVERVRIGERPSHFVQPTEAARTAAIGDLNQLPPEWRGLFQTTAYLPVPDPESNQWLAQHPERHQSLHAYQRMEPNRPSADRRTIYLLPLDDFSGEFAPKLSALREFTEAYFGLPTVLLPPVTLPDEALTSRINGLTQKKQWLTRDVLKSLEGQLPEDGYCLLGVALTDLYPDPKWNFVFGQATLKRRVGVYSFARFDPQFFGDARGPDAEHRMFWRSCRLLAHEAGHMFGILHCVYFSCGMNGTNSQAEADSQPLALCPVCLRKLQWCVGFDPLEREARLNALYRRFGFDGEEHVRFSVPQRRRMMPRAESIGSDE